jgi:hypothetical protein
MAIPGKKIFIWFMALVLIMACAPVMVTPVPTLNPTAINLFIAQTADAASIQTLDAMPPTATITSTPRSTFTPEATITPFQTFVLPSPTPLIRSQFFRVKHDSQLSIYNYKSRTAENWGGVGGQTPEVVQMYIEPSSKSGTNRTDVSGNWETYINALNNNNKKKLNYLEAGNTALFNNSGFPLLESLTMGGNVVSITQLQGGWGRVFTMDYSNPGSVKDINYVTRPDLVHKFVIVSWKNKTKSTYWVNTPQGAIYWPLVSDRTVWIPLDRLEPFPTLPMTVTANTLQEVRTKPELDSPITGYKLSEGRSTRIVEYYPSGSNVWARIENGGWIALLLYQNGKLKYLTDWSMATVPPPPQE